MALWVLKMYSWGKCRCTSVTQMGPSAPRSLVCLTGTWGLMPASSVCSEIGVILPHGVLRAEVHLPPKVVC